MTDEEIITTLRAAVAQWFNNQEMLAFEELIRRFLRATAKLNQES